MSDARRIGSDGRPPPSMTPSGYRTLADRGDRYRAAPARELVQLAAFVVAGETYALDIMRIKEIMKPVPITKVPKSPPFIEGVIELRGAILPVVDLRKRFDAVAAPDDRSTKFLIVAIEGVEGERWIVGLVVDKVLEVMRIARDEVRPAPALALDDHARYFSGVCRHRDRLVMVLDLDAILSSAERTSLAGISHDPRLPSAMPHAVEKTQPGGG